MSLHEEKNHETVSLCLQWMFLLFCDEYLESIFIKGVKYRALLTLCVSIDPNAYIHGAKQRRDTERENVEIKRCQSPLP